MKYTALIVILALVQYTWFSIRVGSARGKYGVEAPATSGNENWERLFRVQMNTLEQLIVFIPLIFIFSIYASSSWAWVPGLVFLVGRQLYAMEYEKDPKSRQPGMGLTFLANTVLLVGSLVGVVLEIF